MFYFYWTVGCYWSCTLLHEPPFLCALVITYTIGTCSCTWYYWLCTQAPVSEVRCALIGRLSLCCRVLRLRVMTWPSTVPPAANRSPSRKPWCTWRGASLRYSCAAGHVPILVLHPAPSYPLMRKLVWCTKLNFLGRIIFTCAGLATRLMNHSKDFL